MQNIFPYSSICITGGTGSFGTALAQHMLSTYPNVTLRIFSRDEYKQALLREKLGDLRVSYLLGDVRDIERLRLAFRHVDLVVHAAALKRVESAEYNPLEFVRTNVEGTANVIRAAIDCTVQRAIFLSTDKSVQSITTYGNSKALAERLWIQGNVYAPGSPSFALVRYGNVFGSRGSVLHIYRECVATHRPLPLTDPRATRFFMDMREAIALVLFAIAYAPRGTIVIPRLPACRMEDVCAALACDAGIEIVGLRIQEKLHEILATDDELERAWTWRGRDACGTGGAYLVPATVASWQECRSEWEAQWIPPPPPLRMAYRSDVWPIRLSVQDLRERLSRIP